MLSFTTLQVGTLVQATFLLGMNTALSSISIASVLLSPSPILALRKWYTQFRRAQVSATTLSAPNLILSLILAYGSSSSSDKSGFANKTTMLYVAGSVMVFLVFPFTLHYMNPINDALIEKYREQEEFHYADLLEKDAGMQTAIILYDVPLTTATLLFIQTLGGAFGVSAAQTAFQNIVLKRLAVTAAGLNPALILEAGASEIRGRIPAEFVEGVLEAYVSGFRGTIIIAIAFSGAAFFAGFDFCFTTIKRTTTLEN